MAPRPARETPERSRIAIYTRISQDQGGYALGVTDQAKSCRELIERLYPRAQVTGPGCKCKDCTKAGTPPDVYCDNDISASGKKKRPHYERLLDDIRAGRIDAVVTTHTDRLHRNVTELETYIDACGDIPTHTVKAGDLDLTTSGGRLVARMLGAAARHELERMTERQLQSHQRGREAGLRTGGRRPFGYRFDARDARGSQIPGVSNGLVIDPDEAEALRRGYDQLLAGASLVSIARDWMAAGFTMPTGRPWLPTFPVRTALLRAGNAGLIEFPAGSGNIVGPAAWDPIVSEETWRAARAILTDPARHTSPGPKPANLLTAVLICGVCGSDCFAIRTGGRPKVRYYGCVSGLRDPTRPGAGFHLSCNKAALDQFVTTEILARLSKTDGVALANRAPEVDIAGLIERRNGLRARLDEIGRAYADGAVDLQQLTAASKPLRESIERAGKALEDAYTRPGLEEFTGGENPKQVWNRLPIERKRAVAATMLRVRIAPAGSRAGRKGYPAFDPGRIEIIWQDGA